MLVRLKELFKKENEISEKDTEEILENISSQLETTCCISSFSIFFKGGAFNVQAKTEGSKTTVLFRNSSLEYLRKYEILSLNKNQIPEDKDVIYHFKRICQEDDEYFREKKNAYLRLIKVAREEISCVKKLTEKETKQVLEHISYQLKHLEDDYVDTLFFEDLSVYIRKEDGETVVLLQNIKGFYKKYEIFEVELED